MIKSLPVPLILVKGIGKFIFFIGGKGGKEVKEVKEGRE
jgi:hypothetical protein